jgi:hypothetical protein
VVQKQGFIMALVNMFTHFTNLALFSLPTPRGRASRYF